MKLADIPGVGSRIRERLLKHYGCEERAILAISEGDVADLSSVLSERQALFLAQWARGMKHGVKPDDFLATEEAARIYQTLISKIAGYAHTDYARLKIKTLYPSSSPAILAENRMVAETAMNNARKLKGRGLEVHLQKIRPLRERPPARVRDRALATSSPEIFRDLKARGLDRSIDLHLADNPRELLDLMGSYSHVGLVGEGECPDGAEQVVSLEDWYLVPESVLSYYQDNLETLTAAVQAARLLQDEGIIETPGLDVLQGLMTKLEAKGDAEAERLSRLLSGLNSSLSEAVSWANEQLKKKIETSSITLAGGDLLQVMSRGEDIRDIFEIQMRSVFYEVLKGSRERVSSQLEMTGPESIWLEEIFSSRICYPLELNKKAVQAFEQDLRAKMEARGIRAKRELAKSLVDKKEAFQKMVASLMEFDFIYALGTFALAERLNLPEISEDACLGFQEGRNLFLAGAEPVGYSLGRTGFADFPEPVAILSGVNSGGKTTLLDLVAQIAILAHMGLPVPAGQCRIGLFEEMYYFSKSRGTLSAGAFETAMRKFAVVENQKRKLVLADELEAITEPGASARIIACMLDELNRLGSVAVFVSHLAEDVKRFCETAVRVDGIEASGLDDQNNLLVNRNPKYNYLARSTPELILDRLVRTTSGKEREFYSRLLSKFR